MNIIGKRHDEDTRRVDRTRKRQRIVGNFFEAERGVIGRIADQNDSFRTLAPGCFDRDPNEFASDASALVGGTHSQRPEQMSRHLTGCDRRHPHRSNRLAVVRADEGKSQIMWPLLANPRCGSSMPTGTECFFVDVFDGCVVRRVLSEVDQIVLVHDETETG